MRARNIKPGFFVNDQLGECSISARLLFIGLFCFADRDGRFHWRPKKMKASIFPFDSVEVDGLLEELFTHGLIVRYEVEGNTYGEIPKFLEHQRPHIREVESVIPPGPFTEPKTYQGTTKAQPRHNLGKGEAQPRCPERGMRNDERGMRKKTKAKKDNEVVCERVLEDLNNSTGKKFQHNETNYRLIKRLLKDGYTEDQFFYVHRVKSRQWRYTEREIYLRPKTLYAPSNFDGYTQEPEEIELLDDVTRHNRQFLEDSRRENGQGLYEGLPGTDGDGVPSEDDGTPIRNILGELKQY